MNDLRQMGEKMDEEIGRHPRILLVDDEEVYRVAMKDWLGLWNYDVVEASSGSEALQKLSDGKFDLIFTDFVMPGLDGLGLLKVIRAEDQFIPILIVTGYDDRLALLAHVENSVTSVASKSVELTVLREHIKRLVGK